MGLKEFHCSGEEPKLIGDVLWYGYGRWGACPKCGRQFYDPKHMDRLPPERKYDRELDLLSITCNACGYGWLEDCADAHAASADVPEGCADESCLGGRKPGPRPPLPLGFVIGAFVLGLTLFVGRLLLL